MRRRSAGGLALVLVLAACNAAEVAPITPSTLTTTSSTSTTTPTVPPETTTTEPSPSGPGHGGTVVLGADQFPQTLNPAINDNTVTRVIGNAWIPRVWDIDATTREQIPDLVTQLPSLDNGGVVLNEDGTMTITYDIDPAAVWSDGVPISGGDFAFTLAVETEREVLNDWPRKPYTDAGIRMTDVGESFFSLTLAEPTMAYDLFFPWIYPAHALSDAGPPDQWTLDEWPSGGPFIIESIEEFDRITLVRNDAYWKVDDATGLALPYLDAVEIRFLGETESLMSAFRDGDIDIIQPPPAITEIVKPLEALEPEGVEVTVASGPVWEHLNFQFGPGRLEMNAASCNDSLTFRRAVAHAVDREALAGYYQGYVEALSSYLDVFAPTISGHAWDRYPHDPVLAGTLYRQAVAETGVECVVFFSTTSNADMRPWVTENLEPMLDEAGIPYERRLMDSMLFFGEVFDNGTWDVGMWAWASASSLSSVAGIHDVFSPSAAPPGGSNYYRWGTRDSSVRDEHTERFAEIIEELHTTVDPSRIVELVVEAEGILADQVVIVPLFARPTVGAVWANEVGGYQHNPTLVGDTWNIERWYRSDR